MKNETRETTFRTDADSEHGLVSHTADPRLFMDIENFLRNTCAIIVYKQTRQSLGVNTLPST